MVLQRGNMVYERCKGARRACMGAVAMPCSAPCYEHSVHPLTGCLVTQRNQALQLQEVQVPEALLRLLCSRSVLSELQLLVLLEY